MIAIISKDEQRSVIKYFTEIIDKSIHFKVSILKENVYITYKFLQILN